MKNIKDTVKTLEDKIEQLRVQLAGCGVAALGYAKGKNDCKKGGYGWSQSFEDVKTLWAKYSAVLKQVDLADDTIDKLTARCKGYEVRLNEVLKRIEIQEIAKLVCKQSGHNQDLSPCPLSIRIAQALSTNLTDLIKVEK